MRTQDKEPRPLLGAFHKSRSHTKNLPDFYRTTPRLCGEDFKTQNQRTTIQSNHLRNCRNFRKRELKWRVIIFRKRGGRGISARESGGFLEVLARGKSRWGGLNSPDQVHAKTQSRQGGKILGAGGWVWDGEGGGISGGGAGRRRRFRGGRRRMRSGAASRGRAGRRRRDA